MNSFSNQRSFAGKSSLRWPAQDIPPRGVFDWHFLGVSSTAILLRSCVRFLTKAREAPGREVEDGMPVTRCPSSQVHEESRPSFVLCFFTAHSFLVALIARRPCGAERSASSAIAQSRMTAGATALSFYFTSIVR
jgi:hypothetical protein